MSKKPLLCLAALLAAGAAQAQDATALAAFERIARTCKAAFEVQPLDDVILHPITKKWVHRVFSRATVAYDVQRTNSLVTPYQAKIRIEQAFNSNRADDEASARALQVALDAGGIQSVDVIEFAFQDGKWQLSGGDTIDKGPLGTKLRRPPEAWRRLQGPVLSCLGD